MWEIFFIISFIVNIFLLLYARWLIKSYAILTEDIYAVNEMILKFSEHIKAVNELEMFYGDETLASLISHGKELIDKIQGLDLLVEDEENDKEETQEN